MTIAIVAITTPLDVFVTVTDRRVSHDDIIQASDDETYKSISIAKNWYVAYATQDISYIDPLLEAASEKLGVKDDWNITEIKDIMSNLCATTLQNKFFSKKLSRYGYKDVEQFRKEGRQDLGDHYFDLCRELDKFDLGLTLLVHGFDNLGTAHLFEVDSAGHVSDRAQLRYGIIGSGYWIASASMRRRPINFNLDSAIYRLLEAKFCAETAREVGRTTEVQIIARDSRLRLKDNDIEKIRSIWERTIKRLIPKAHYNIFLS